MNAPQTKSYHAEPNTDGSAQLHIAGHMADDIAATYGTEPLANLTATREYLNITSARGDFRLPRAAITHLGRGSFYPWFFSAVRIHHNVAGLPRNLQFKPLGLKPREVMTKLRELGYPTA